MSTYNQTLSRYNVVQECLLDSAVAKRILITYLSPTTRAVRLTKIMRQTTRQGRMHKVTYIIHRFLIGVYSFMYIWDRYLLIRFYRNYIIYYMVRLGKSWENLD